LLAEVAGFLEPFEEATKDMEADHVPTLQKTALWFYKLQKILSASTGSPISRCLNARALRFLKQKFTFGIFHKVSILLCPIFKKLSVFPEGMRPDVMSTVRQFIADFPDPVSSADSQPTQDSNFRPGDKRGASDKQTDHVYVPEAKRPYRFPEFEDNEDSSDETEDDVAVYIRTNFSYPAEETFDPLMF